MSDILCANIQKLYHIILTEGGTLDDAKKASEEIKQPSKGYYPITNIYKFLEKKRAEKCKQ
tara:strand:+ start:309 stop:491 length:183 start_codon:yes stop_codon:yes gene_type:complete